MKKIILCLIFFVPFLSYAESKITTITFGKQNDVVVIKYFMDAPRFDDVAVLMASKGRLIRLNNVVGDVGTVRGKGTKTILFNMFEELGVDTLPKDAFFTVIGVEAVPKNKPKQVYRYDEFHMSFDFLYTSKAAIGFGLAAFSKWGGYMHARFSTIGIVFSPPSEGYTLEVTGHVYHRQSFTAGVVRMIHRRIAVYGGLGYGEYALVNKGNEVSDYGFVYPEDYYWDKPMSKGLELEAGLMFNLYGVSLSIGYSALAGEPTPFLPNLNIGIGYVMTF